MSRPECRFTGMQIIYQVAMMLTRKAEGVKQKVNVDKQMHPIPPFVHMNQKHAEPPGWNGKPQGEPRSLDGQRHLDGQRTRWNHPRADWKPVEWATQIEIAAQSPNQIVQTEYTHTQMNGTSLDIRSMQKPTLYHQLWLWSSECRHGQWVIRKLTCNRIGCHLSM